MRNDNNPNFSQIVCSSESVQSAFADHRPLRFWWNLILRLHGKPVHSSISREEKIQRIADGFKFYAWLYRFLAVIFLLLAPAFVALHIVVEISFYWAIASLMAAVYLWCVSSLGYTGATQYVQGQPQSTGVLVAFMVMVVAFLSMFVAVVSVVAQHSAWLSPVPNLIAASALFVFGVGSYMIEILYLTTGQYEQDNPHCK